MVLVIPLKLVLVRQEPEQNNRLLKGDVDFIFRFLLISTRSRVCERSSYSFGALFEVFVNEQ